MRRPVLLVAVVVSLLGAVVAADASRGAAGTGADIAAFRGLGTWVDSFDYATRLQRNGDPPPFTDDSVDDMAKLGVQTLYLQVANPDGAAPTALVDADVIRAVLARAHRAGLRVVAWYLPSLADVSTDYRMVQTIADFKADGARFDGIGLDVEDTTSVTDIAVRDDRLVDLVQRSRKLLGTRPLGAIVYPAVQTEVINPVLWPAFPYKRLAPSVDVWLPMTYFTFRDTASGYRDAFTYTDESIRRLRRDLKDGSAAVHPIGGIADQTTPADYVGFLRAARDDKSIGYSVYDYDTTASSAWPLLRKG
jgi:hypothetical protein